MKQMLVSIATGKEGGSAHEEWDERTFSVNFAELRFSSTLSPQNQKQHIRRIIDMFFF
jgi:hypothetical protein